MPKFTLQVVISTDDYEYESDIKEVITGVINDFITSDELEVKVLYKED